MASLSKSSAELHDLFKLFELAPTPDLEIIKAHYRKMAALHHPDRGGSEAKMQEVNTTYARIIVLLDFERCHYVYRCRACNDTGYQEVSIGLSKETKKIRCKLCFNY